MMSKVVSTVGPALSAALTAAVLTAHLHGPPAQSQPERVVARAFVVVDPQGVERASLAVGEDGIARLELHDPAGQRRVAVEASEEHAFVRFGGTGRPHLGIGVLAEQTVGHFMGPVDVSTVTFQARPETARLVMSGPWGLMGLGRSTADLGLTMFDTELNRVDIRLEGEGERIRISEQGETIWAAP